MSMKITDKAEFKDRIRRWAEKLDARVTAIAVRPMTTKWASYSTAGRLTFDSFLLEFREELQDYVIVHASSGRASCARTWVNTKGWKLN
jgi:predicted metal-dependent hydrolase